MRLWRCEPGSSLATELGAAAAFLPGWDDPAQGAGSLPCSRGCRMLELVEARWAAGAQAGGSRWGSKPSPAPQESRVRTCLGVRSRLLLLRCLQPWLGLLQPCLPAETPGWVLELLFDQSSASVPRQGTAAGGGGPAMVGGGTGCCLALFAQRPPLSSPAMAGVAEHLPGPADSSALQASSSRPPAHAHAQPVIKGSAP